jgi:hypothetical protein
LRAVSSETYKDKERMDAEQKREGHSLRFRNSGFAIKNVARGTTPLPDGPAPNGRLKLVVANHSRA